MSLQDQLKQFRKSLDGQYSGQLPKAATHIEQDLLAIIGEDEYPPHRTGAPESPHTIGDDRRVTRNLLRAELRTAITAYCKGETK